MPLKKGKAVRLYLIAVAFDWVGSNKLTITGLTHDSSVYRKMTILILSCMSWECNVDIPFCHYSFHPLIVQRRKLWWTYPTNKILLIQMWIVAREIKALKQAEILSHRTTSLRYFRWNHAKQRSIWKRETDIFMGLPRFLFVFLTRFGNCGLIPRLLLPFSNP